MFLEGTQESVEFFEDDESSQWSSSRMAEWRLESASFDHNMN